MECCRVLRLFAEAAGGDVERALAAEAPAEVVAGGGARSLVGAVESLALSLL